MLYVRDSVDGEGRMLIDPNGWSADGATALGEWEPSEDGRHLLYSVQDGGTDWRTLRVLDVATAKPLADEVKWVKFSDRCPGPRTDRAFTIRASPSRAAGGTYQSLNENHTVYFHKLGTPQSADRLVFATPRRTDLNNTRRGQRRRQMADRHLVERHRRALRGHADRPYPPLGPAAGADPGLQHNYSYIGNQGSTFHFLTNEGAPKLKVVSIDVAARARSRAP